MAKVKIFVSAFSCMPHIGSEPGVGWHWIMEMSKYYELWVLVHKEQVDDIEVFVKSQGIDKKIHFIYYDIPFNSWFFKEGKFRWVRLYYNIWIALSNRIVERTMQENDIKIFHHLTFGNALWPVSRYGQKQFFIWGPIGGTETIRSEFSQHYSWKSRFVEWVRRLAVKIVCKSPAFYKRCDNANLILCKTETMRMSVSQKNRDKAILFTDVAVGSLVVENIVTEKNESSELHYISVGRLDAWRGFDILIEAFRLALQVYPNMKLTIIGEGTDRKRLAKLIEKYKIKDKILLIGNVSINEYNQIISQCDVVVNSCLKEGAVTVSFDSMRYGKPLICIDSGGFTRYFSDNYAKVLPQQSRQELISSMRQAILDLTDKDSREKMGNLAQMAGEMFLWEEKGRMIQKTINDSISQ